MLPAHGVRRLPALWRGVHLSPQRWRVLGGLALSLGSLVACVLVARLLSGASWPLDGARVSLVLKLTHPIVGSHRRLRFNAEPLHSA